MMKNANITLAATLAAVMALSTNADEALWENRPTGYRDKDGASEWWTTTWKTGDRVETVSHYQFYGRLTGRKEDLSELKWYSIPTKIAAKVLEHDHEVDIQGTSKCVNMVLAGGKDEAGKDVPVQIVRSFECPISARGASVIGLKHGDKAEVKVAEAYIKFYDMLQDPEVQSFMRDRMEEGKVFARGAIQAGLLWVSHGSSLVTAPATDAAIKLVLNSADRKLTAYASRKAETVYKKAAERHLGGTYDSEGGVEAKKKSPFYRKLKGGGEALANFATVFNGLFDGKDFYLCAGRGDKVCARQLLNDQGFAGEAFRLVAATNAAPSTRPRKMQEIEPTPDEARVGNILSRETFNVNAVLFDLRERKPGETWAASATILNNFLHPDLKGKFRGIICMTYEGDETISISIPEALDKEFNVRHLSMTKRTSDSETNFVYHEPKNANDKGEFEFAYDPEDKETSAEIDIWVDKESGYIVKANAHMEGKVAFLPDLALAKGWSFRENEGKLVMSLDSESLPSRLLSAIGQ